LKNEEGADGAELGECTSLTAAQRANRLATFYMLHEKCLERIESPMVIPRKYRDGTRGGGSCLAFQGARRHRQAPATFPASVITN
jgi:hypothetical protein